LRQVDARQAAAVVVQRAQERLHGALASEWIDV
jgi:hypothetical protein